MTSSTDSEPEDALFAGPGEIRALCRALDWSATPLGPVAGWPQSLRAVVGLCLDSRTTMAIWAGPALTLIHNQGYQRVLGPKYPWAMGHQAREVWPELWEVLGSELQQVMASGVSTRNDEARYRLRRDGRDEDAYFTYSFTPIREDDGRVVGVLNVLEEITSSVRARTEGEAFLAFALNTARMGAWDMDLASHAVHRSHEHDRIFGYEQHLPHWTYEMFLEHVLPEDRQEVDRLFQRAAESEGDWSFECRIVRRDGQTRWIWASGRHRADEHGHRRMAGIMQDITDRKRADAALRESEARKAFLLKLSDALRPLGDPLEVQAKACRVMGEHIQASRAFYVEVETKEDGYCFDIKPHYHTPDVPDLSGNYRAGDIARALFDRLRAGRTVVVSDVAAQSELTAEDRQIHLAAHVLAHIDVPLIKGGRLVGIFAVHQAVPRAWTEEEIALMEETAERTWAAAERARAEDALRQSQSRLEQERARLQAIIDTIPVGLFIVEASGKVAVANDEAKRVWAGVVPLATISDYAEYKGYWPQTGERLKPEDWPAAQALLYGRKLKGVVVDIERFDGTRGTIMFSGAPIKDASDTPAGAVVAIQDISALQEAHARLAEADRRKNYFLAVLSHELRNPLAPVKNSLHILNRVSPDGEQARRARDVIERQIDQLSHLVDDLLDVTRITRGKIELQRHSLELNELVRRTLEDHRTLFDRFQIDLRLETAATPVFINADWSRVAQVLGNLLQNAAKFTPRGGRVDVAVSIDPPARQAIVRVVDTGAGMTPEVLARLFEPFMQADETLDRSKGGLGLGLALVKGLVELHGGTVETRSAGLGQGSEFTVRLPLEAAAQPDGEHVRPSAAKVYRRVLVIEDNADAADTLREILELDGHAVVVAYNGPEGLAKAREFHPDFVICDISLPGMDGYAVARAFRADPAVTGVRLVALSGYALAADLQRAFEAGFERYLTKPPSLEQLASVLTNWGDSQSERAERRGQQ